MARGSAGESVLHRHLRILDAFDAFHPFLSLSEIVASSGVPPSSAHRLVGELEREGLLERMPDLTYRLGLRLWEFGARTPGALGLREIARPWLAAVHQRIRQHTQLGVRTGEDVLFIERMSVPDAVINATLIGGRIPLHASASGLVLLADQPLAHAARYGARELRSYTDRTVTDPGELERVLRRVRSDGFAVTDGYIHPEARGIAVPVRGPGGSAYAGLGVVVPNDGSSPQSAIEVLTVAARGIARALTEAYGPDATGGARPLAGVSQRSRDYIASLDDAARRT